MPLEVSIQRLPRQGEAFVLACFSYRYDAHLVPGLLANIAPVVHGWIACDDRTTDVWYSSEPERRRLLLDAARRHGAEWLLVIDPDERVEDAAAARIGELTAAANQPVWTVDMHEMFAPGFYRTDGIWGGRLRQRLFPLADDIAVPEQGLHAAPFIYDRWRPIRPSGLAFYHLRMMTPERRHLRRDQYALLDPGRKMQALGYDYLAMDAGARLVAVPPERDFSPPHVEDGGLWAPALPAASPAPPPDPVECRMRLLQANRAKDAPALVAEIARQTAADHPGDHDLHLLAAALAAEAGLADQALTELGRAAAAGPATAAAALIEGRLHLAAGDRAAAQAAAARAQDLAPDSLPVRQLADRAWRDPQTMAAPGALWRRWVNGPATIREGAQMSTASAMTVVVLAFRAQAGLAGAVRSILDQRPATEVVVVNSGGGNPAAALGPLLPFLRLIDIAEPHQVGAIRNVGIDASSAPVVAFLAADCLAGPGWVQGRLDRHAAGAAAVANAIIPADPGNAVAWVSSASLRWSRWPSVTAMHAPGYGLSYARPLFDEIGYFPTGLRGTEDTVVNTMVHARHGVDWAPDIVTAHRDPLTAADFCKDMKMRGFWRVQHVARWRQTAAADLPRRIEDDRRQRLRDARQAMALFGSGQGDASLHRLLALGARAGALGHARGLRQLAEAARLGTIADGLSRDGDRRSALVLAGECAVLDSQNAAHHLRIARIWFADRNMPQAVAAARRGLALDPGNVALVELACKAAYSVSRFDEAMMIAEMAALTAPTQSPLWVMAYQYASRGGHRGRALLNAQMAFLADPSAPQVNGFLSHAWGHLGADGQTARRVALQGALSG